MTLKEIIKNIEGQIMDCKKYNEDLDCCSWPYQGGVLISANSAQKILNALKSKK